MRKRVLAPLVFLFVLANPAFAENLTVDSYGVANRDSEILFLGTVVFGATQSIQPLVKAKITDVQFSLRKTGSPTGDMTAIVYVATGTHGTNAIPSGNTVATSAALDVSTLTTSFTATTLAFSLGSQITLLPYIIYSVGLDPSGATLDISNYVHVGTDASSPVHAGNAATVIGGTWSADTSQDLVFTLQGNRVEDLTGGGSQGQQDPLAGTETLPSGPLAGGTAIIALAGLGAIYLFSRGRKR